MFSEIDLFSSEDGKYGKCRIPGLVVTQSGVVISYCEARESGSDWAVIDICMKRSLDGGKTWEDNIILVNGYASRTTVNNPVMIAENDSDTVHFLYCVEYAACYYRRSLDAGKTWTEPVEITSVFEEFRPEYPWTVIATGPCHGIQLSMSGRLIVPVWLSPDHSHRPSVVASIYSDDRGETWKRGEILRCPESITNPSETAVVELANGQVLFNIRNESFIRRRAVTISDNGCSGWSQPAFDWQLVDPVCCGGITRYEDKTNPDNHCILFSNPDSTEIRKNLIIKASRDNGKTWEVSKLLHIGGAGYSDLFAGTDGTVYCFYEKIVENADPSLPEEYYLTMAMFDMEWLINF